MPTSTSDASPKSESRWSRNASPAPLMRFDKEELRARLDPIVFHVTQEKGTEKANVNKYCHVYSKGTYACAVCSVALFSSDTKYDARSGWPAFFDILDKDKIRTRADASAVGGNLLRIINEPGLVRTEVICANCFAHLGHVFDDGPPPTGKRYCVNSASLEFVPRDNNSCEERKPPMVFPARLQGCGANGMCTRPRSPLRAAALTQRLDAYKAKAEETFEPKRQTLLI